MKLTLVVNTYNNPTALERIFEEILQGSEAPHEIVIADDGSDERTRELIDAWRKKFPFPLLHAWQEKKGYRRSRILNLAISLSSGDYIVFIDGDCIPGHHFVRDHRLVAEEGCFVQGRRSYIAESMVQPFLAKKVGLLGIAMRGKLEGPFKAVRLPFPLVFKNQELKSILGCNLGIWRRDLDLVNGYDESYEGWGAEDSDLAARLYHCGRQRKFVYGRCQLYHLNHPKLSRNRYDNNKAMLQKTLETKKTRCENGLNNHTATAG